MTEANPNSSSNPVLQLGSYQLQESLGSGGMSSVFRAIHEASGLEVAVKVLPRYLAKNPILLQRFLREAQNAESLEHPNIVSIYDRGSENGRYYLVLEYVPGLDLHDLVKNEGPLSLADAVHVVEHAAEALKYAASKGVIHRDIKPANLLRGRDGEVKLIDLGLALQNEAEDERVTRAGTTVGTVDYMSPEQARDSRAATVRSDIYSLGCTLYYLLTGLPPYPGGDIADKLRRHAQLPPPALARFRPDVPAALVQIFQRMMAKNPEQRYPDYESLLADLRGLPPESLVEDEGFPVALIDDELGLDEEADFELGLVASPGIVESTKDGIAPPTTVSRKAVDAPALASPSVHPPEIQPPSPSVDRTDLARLADEDAEPEPTTAPVANRPVVFTEMDSRPRALVVPPSLPTSPDLDSDWEIPVAPASGHTWAVGGALAGLALALLALGLYVLRNRDTNADSFPAKPDRATSIEQELKGEPAPPEPEEGDNEPFREHERPRRVPDLAGSEPVPLPNELSVPYPILRTFLPDPALFRVERVLPTPRIVRRNLRPTLAEALAGPANVPIELQGLGPFFIDSFTFHGVLRATKGQRAVVVLDARRNPRGNGSTIIPLDSVDLTLEGIDLIVLVPETLPAGMSLFACRGKAKLILQECSITIATPRSTPANLDLVRVEPDARGPGPAIQFEDSQLRGAAGSLVSVRGSSFHLEMSRAIWLGTQRPAFRIETPGAGGEVYLRRTLLAASGPLIDLDSTASGSGPENPREEPTRLYAAASCFASLASDQPSLVRPSTEPDGSPRLIWEGFGNTYLGWADPQGETAGPRFDELEAEWSTNPDPVSDSDFVWIEAEQLASRIPTFAPTLLRALALTPHLRERTAGQFERWPVRDDGELVHFDSLETSQAEHKRQRDSSATPTGTVHEWDPGSPEYMGDLGVFVNRITPGVKDGWARIKVMSDRQDWGTLRMTPIHVPPGVSLEIEVEEKLRGRIRWEPRPEFLGPALISVQRGRLHLLNLDLTVPSDSAIERVVVHHGEAVRLSDCRLRLDRADDPIHIAALEHRGPSLRVDSTDPEPVASTPERIHISRTVLSSRSKGLDASLVSGVVAVEDSVLMSVGPALVVRREPSESSSAFRGEVWLDRSTIASENAMIEMIRPTSLQIESDRPWVVFSQQCHFLDDYADRPRTTPVLQTDPDVFEHGRLVWQGNDDGFEVGRFVQVNGETPTTPALVNLRDDWIRLWGPDHVSARFGPTSGDQMLLMPPKSGRLSLGKANPAELLRADGQGLRIPMPVGANPDLFKAPNTRTSADAGG